MQVCIITKLSNYATDHSILATVSFISRSCQESLYARVANILNSTLRIIVYYYY
jgi:hypothetical protein